MEQLKNIINTYQDIIKSAEQKLGKAKQQIYRIGTLRLILFDPEANRKVDNSKRYPFLRTVTFGLNLTF